MKKYQSKSSKHITQNVSTTRSVIKGGLAEGPPYMLIPLTQGKFAIVDAADFEWLSKQKWYAKKDWHTYYAFSSKGISMHRQILGLKKGDGKLTDHKNGNGLDDRRSNIRVCTCSENSQNLHKLKKGKSCEYQGVHKHRRTGQWRARIKKNQKLIHIGLFADPEEAARVYDRKALELFGPDAKTNFPKENYNVP